MAEENKDPTKVGQFLGLVNTLDPLQAPIGALLVADNIDIDDAASIRRRDGYTLASSFTDVYGAFASEDQKYLYVIDDGSLYSVQNDFTSTLVATDFPKGQYEFEEVGARIYILGPRIGYIDNGEFKPWGVVHGIQPGVTRTSGQLPAGTYSVACAFKNIHGEIGGVPAPVVITVPADSTLVIEVPQLANHSTVVYVSSNNSEYMYRAGETQDVTFLLTSLTPLISPLSREQYQRYPVPMNATQLTYYQGKMYVGEYSQTNNNSYIYSSEPFWLGLFDLFGSYITVPGEIRLLHAYSSGILIGTDMNIMSFSTENGLTELASYGVPKGTQASEDPTGEVFFWSNRGVCRVPNFTNLTQTHVSVPAGSTCVTAFVEQQGYNRFLISTTSGGVGNNKYT